MGKMEFQGDVELTKTFPERWTSIVEITTRDKQVHSLRVDLPKGGPENPMTDREIESKFSKMPLKLMPKAQVDQIIKAIYDLDKPGRCIRTHEAPGSREVTDTTRPSLAQQSASVPYSTFSRLRLIHM